MSKLSKKNDIINEYKTEADVESKFVYNIFLRDILEVSSKLINLHVPVKITQGRKRMTKEADVVIKNEAGENMIVIDSKSPVENLEDYFDQIDSYAFNLEAPISILTNYHRMIVRVYLSGNKKEVVLDENIESLKKNDFKKLKSIINQYKRGEISKKNDTCQISKKEKDTITDYRRMFRQIHTKIRSIDKLDPSASFDEFSKILFIKIINDIVNDDEKLTVKRIEAFGTTKSQSKYIDEWFQEKVKQYYPGIFASNEKISVSPTTLMIILDILNKEFKLKDTLADIKGRAFEEFLPSQLRGKGLGQFFTPRPVVDFMIELADISVTDKVLDFASGSGGFLIKAFEKKRQLIASMQKQYLDFLGKTKEELLEETKTQIFGIDAEPRAVRTAKMNMLLWGDGKQIQHGNGLDTKDYKGNSYFAKEYDDNNPDDTGVDVILANPPFGSIEEEQLILRRYSLSKNKKQKDGTIIKSKEKTENLFVEKAYKMLKPGGKLLIVLPEGIFSNGDSRTRNFIMSRFTIDTIVKLPKHSFVMSGVDTINSVILIARKNTDERNSKIKLSDKKTWINKKGKMAINFASVNQIGYEPSGKTLFGGYENSDLKIIADKLNKGEYSTLLADPIDYATLEFGSDDKSEAWKKSMVKFLRKEFEQVPKRLDPTYYFFYEETKDILDGFISLPIKEENTQKIKLTEKELNKDVEQIYKYVSVVKTIDGKITEVEEKTVDEILSTKSGLPQKLFKNDIVFNPYRINTGSVIYINSNEKNLITSPAYIVLRNIDINIEYFVQLLKTPFMKYQIQVLASGSVRDNFSASDLVTLKIPNVSKTEQIEKVKKVNKSVKAVKARVEKINREIESISSILTDFSDETD